MANSITKKTISTRVGEITVYTIFNKYGAYVELSSLGAGINAIFVPDKDGNLDDVVIGYTDPADYMADGPCAGKTPGRYANRIALGQMRIADIDYQLAVNNGPNHLHGGPTGFQNHIWKSEIVDDTVRFSLLSPDGDENYPGNMIASVTYTWNDSNELRIDYKAMTDAPTVVNLTNHSYFNLDGESSGTVLNSTLQLFASRYLPTSDSLIPTGEIAPVAGTPMDFTSPKTLGRDIKQDFPALIYGKGYDNCWVIDDWEKGELKKAAILTANSSGRVLEVFTTQPAVQVYTGNWIGDSPVSRSGHKYADYDAVAIECQGMPDAPNKPQFPSQLLLPGDEYTQSIIFKFSIK